MATAPKQTRKANKRKPTEDTTMENLDLDLSADDLHDVQHQSSDGPAELIKQLYGTITDLRKSHSHVKEKLTQIGLRIDQGDIAEHQWKKSGLAKQYSIANSFLKTFETAKIQFINGDKEKGIISMDEGIANIKQRMHCIRIADSSPADWETVNEYLSSPLATDDEDDKRLKRAEKTAMDNLKDRSEAKRGRGRYGSNDRGRGYIHNRGDRASEDDNRPQFRSYGSYRGGSYRSSPSLVPARYSDQAGNRDRRDWDSCYYCGSQGHWADKCPQKQYDNRRQCKLTIYPKHIYIQ